MEMRWYLMDPSQLCKALREARFELCAVEVAPDKDDSVGPLLCLRPRSPNPVRGRSHAEEHVHALEDVAVGRARHREHAFGAKDVDALFAQEPREPVVELGEVELPFPLEADARDGAVVLVLTVHVEKGVVHLQNAPEVKGANPEHLVQGRARKLRVNHGCVLVNLAHASHNRRLLRLVHQINFIEQDSIGEGHLLHRFVLHSLWFFLVQVLHDVLRVHHREDAVEPHRILNLVVHKEGLGDGGGVREARRLNQNIVVLVFLEEELAKNADEVAADRAAYAAVVELQNLLLRRHHEQIVNPNLAKLVDHNRNPLPMLLLEQVVDKRRLPSAEKPCDDRHRHLPRVFRCHVLVCLR
mmetsp:Transcript_4574/g.15770  ORF Transcript_4574/g.15770 Transcript_4574/m.15770 type:complete len:355 (-) Transcript_4574:33-1097(-)